MDELEQVRSFAREYINVKRFRTIHRKELIRKVYRQVTGQTLKISCSTCFVEALLTIINHTDMATKKGYELKQGVLLQAFGDASKTCTNATLTDALAEWHLSRCPEKIIYFSKVPPGSPFAPTKVKPQVVIPKKVEKVVPQKQPTPNYTDPDGVNKKFLEAIAKEDQVKRQALIDKLFDLGFKNEPESPVELMTSTDLETIIAGLEAAKKDSEEKIEEKSEEAKDVEKTESEPKTETKSKTTAKKKPVRRKAPVKKTVKTNE